jgi:L-amino acid N-acyltransferase YncA
MTEGDWPSVARIYAAGIESGNATFEREVPSWPVWSAARQPLPCLVARRTDGDVIGWAALSPTSTRAVYRGVAAISIYVDPASRQEGVARRLLLALIDESERAGLWTLEAGIFPENAASVALHERCGFRLVGVRRSVGQMADGCWRDVLLYERRSELVGGLLA